MWTLRLSLAHILRQVSLLAILFWEPYLYAFCQEVRKHILTHPQSHGRSQGQNQGLIQVHSRELKNTLSYAESSSWKHTRQYTFLSQRILKAYKAIYFLMTEDPEIIPDNILCKDIGSWNHTRQYTFSGSRILKSYRTWLRQWYVQLRTLIYVKWCSSTLDSVKLRSITLIMRMYVNWL